jgi:hypothetical protein
MGTNDLLTFLIVDKIQNGCAGKRMLLYTPILRSYTNLVGISFYWILKLLLAQELGLVPFA